MKTLNLFAAASLAAFMVLPRHVPAAPGPNVEPVSTGLEAPLSVTHAGDGSGRLFVTLQGGRIVVVRDGALLAAPFLDISSLTSAGGEQGLLGTAFHPDYAANGLFYVNYTDLSGNTVVARYAVSADPDGADPASGEILLTIDQPFANHNGGQLQFGPDGYLYIATGDGGDRGDPLGNGQNLSTLLGKLLRIDADGAFPYAVPPDNPFVGTAGARGEIWAFGLRNPWRFSFDRLTGDLFIADVGQRDWEEVNFQRAGSAGGQNYGWRLMEGTHCFDPPSGCNDGSLALPVIEYGHDAGCSVTGGYRYRGSAAPWFSGLYLFADFCSGTIWGAGKSGGTVEVTELVATDFQISSFGEDEAGEVYFTDYGSGTLFRIVYAEDFTLDLQPVQNTVPPGGTVEISVTASNGTPAGATVRFASDVVVPGGERYPLQGFLYGPKEAFIGPFTTVGTAIRHRIPGKAPGGVYLYRGYVTDTEGRLVAKDAFEFQVVPPP